MIAILPNVNIIFNIPVTPNSMIAKPIIPNTVNDNFSLIIITNE